jgi:hypothetical protein
MKSFPKLFILFAAVLLLLQVASISYFQLAPEVRAEADLGSKLENLKINVPFWHTLNSMPSITQDKCANADAQCYKIPWIAIYISAAYKYGVVLGSMLAVIMLMIGGIMYMMAGLNQTLVSKGKSYITGAVLGLTLLLGSYVMLNTINPNLTKLAPVEVEVIKAEGLTIGNPYCYEYEKSKYDVVDAACGEKGTYKSNDPQFKHEGECRGSICTGDEFCIPTLKTDPFSEASPETCQDVAVWGYFYADEGRFLDGVGLMSLEGFSDVDCIELSENWQDPTWVTCLVSDSDIPDPKSDDKMYVIPKSSLSLSQYKDSYILLVELNDTGSSRAKVTNSIVIEGSQAVANWFGMPGTFDDEYYLASNPKFDKKDGKGRTITQAIWMEPCMNAAVVVEGQNGGWIARGDNKMQYFKTFQKSDLQKGIRVDIYAGSTQEDTTADCSLVSGSFPPTRKLLQECGSDGECISGDCEYESGTGVGDVAHTKGVQKCECTSNQDCIDNGNTDAFCSTSVATWNVCTQWKVPGKWVYNGATLIEGKHGSICEKGLFSHVVGYSNDQCYGTSDCEGEYNPVEVRCECNSDADCSLFGDDYQCAETEGDGCGWNTCVKGKLPDGHVCYNHNDCQSGYCPKADVGSCDICAPSAFTCTKGKYLDSCQSGGDAACCPGFDCMTVAIGDNQCEPINQATCTQYYPGTDYVWNKLYPNECKKK